MERRAGIAVTLEADDFAASLPRPVEEALYRIAQETLNNVMPHARAAAVTVTLAARDGWVELVVADNGIGFDA